MSDNSGNYCLAMYDVRGKQKYIFNNKHIIEIMGASQIIADIFNDYFYKIANKYYYEKYNEKTDDAIHKLSENENEFKVEKFKNRKLGEVIYDGGGNFYVLFKNKEDCIEINKRFTKEVLEKTATLKVLCAFVEVSKELNNYKKDEIRLKKLHRELESVIAAEMPSEILPITQVDPLSSLALSSYRNNEKNEKISDESYAKRQKYTDKFSESKEGTRILDDLAEDKGNESMLAVVYIDGNSMGKKVSELLKEEKTYEECISKLRKFSKRINHVFIEKGMECVDKTKRIIIDGGDEVNFIVNARDAKRLVEKYFDTIIKCNNEEEKDFKEKIDFSACAGISIFHSHAPYYDAYRIAEECCETGKKEMRDKNLEHAFYYDFQYNQSAIGLDLDKIREIENGNLISRPWRYDEEKKVVKEVDEIIQELKNRGISRTSIKSLVNAAKKGKNDYDVQLSKIIAHSKTNNEDSELLRNNMNYVYDIGIIYDLWYAERKQKNEEENKDNS